MSYTVCEKVIVGSLSVLFCLIAITTTALVLASSFWFKNQQGKRSREYKKEQDRIVARADEDRKAWQALLAERDKQIDQLLAQVASLSGALSRTKALLEKSEEMRSKA